MAKTTKIPSLLGFNIIFALIMTEFLLGGLALPEARTPETELLPEIPEILTVQGNSLLPLSDPSLPEKEVVRRIKVVATAYSSSPQETDDSPYITAAGTWVREGVIANNLFPFGTKIKIPEIYGDKIFVVEDRMSWKKSNYQIDIWFPDYWQALDFGAKTTYIEVLES